MAETRANTVASKGADPNNAFVDGSTSAASGADRAMLTGESSDPEKGGVPVAGGPAQKQAAADATEREKQLASMLKESDKAQKDALANSEKVSKELDAAQKERDELQARLNELEGELAAARASAPFGIAEPGTITVDHTGTPVA